MQLSRHLFPILIKIWWDFSGREDKLKFHDQKINLWGIKIQNWDFIISNIFKNSKFGA
jgi:hypothetical protein